MQRWSPDDLQPRELTFGRGGLFPDAAASASPTGLILTCTAECFAPDLLAAQLTPDAWLIHRTPANVVPPFGADSRLEEELIEHAVAALKVREIVVCGHAPCSLADHLRTPDQPEDDFILRHWLSHSEAARRTLAGLPEADARAAAEWNALAQVSNLMTHPAIAAAVARGRLRVGAWLSVAGELLYPAAGEARFTRLAALNPDHNCGLRREVVQRPRPRYVPRVLDPRRLEWS